MVLNISQALHFWVTVEVFLFSFFVFSFSCYDTSYGQAVEQFAKGENV